MMSEETWSVCHAIVRHAVATPDRPALTIDGETWSYGELLGAAQALAEKLPPANSGGTPPVTAIIADRHLSSYLGILACLLRGHTYCPINSENPAKRNEELLRRSQAQHIICGATVGQRAEIKALMKTERGKALTLLPCFDRKADFHLTAAANLALPVTEIDAHRLAYILFTSGSTGEPKGVPISHSNLTAYVDAAKDMIGARPDDRFSQTFGLTFDPSVHDIYVCWSTGAHLFVPTQHELARPADFIRDHAITCWFTVPSMGFLIRSQGDLTAGAFPSLRSSLFCGEMLPTALALEWAVAAPNGSVENWYGPTEATIVCARYVLPQGDQSAVTAKPSIPIGTAFPNMSLTVHDEALAEVPDGEPGELLLCGPQVASGYLNDPGRSAKSFVSLPDREGLYYRTGDQVVREPNGVIHIIGRMDNQVKIRGYRVELGAIEAVLREAAGNVNAIALAWPPDEPARTSIVAALECNSADTDKIITAVRTELPIYMVPSRVVCIETFPISAAGKIDRKSIAATIKASFASEQSESQNLEPLTQEQERLMSAVLQVSPALSRDRILSAPSLIAAGMDSLSFVSLTAEIERTYAVPLDQDIVVELSQLSFRDMVERLDASSLRHNSESGLLSRLSAALHKGLRAVSGLVKPAKPELGQRRANRALQFIDRFPGYIAAEKKPTIMIIGSSGVYRALAPLEFEQEAQTMGYDVRCLNVGLPAISCAGISDVCAFVRDTCKSVGMRMPIVIYELDPMHISVTPPKGDLNLSRDHFSGRIKPQSTGELDPEFDWDAESGGLWAHNDDSTRRRLRPKWEKDRDYEIARTYLGDVDFKFEELDDWFRGAAALKEVADRVICFIHPADQTMTRALAAEYQGDRFEELLARLRANADIELMPMDGFELGDDDFMNINHVNPWQGMAALSRQMARLVLRV